MKVSINEEQEFKPVTLEITFETAKEMKDFKSLTEYAPLCDYFRRVDIDITAINAAIPCESYICDGSWEDFVGIIKDK